MNCLRKQISLNLKTGSGKGFQNNGEVLTLQVNSDMFSHSGNCFINLTVQTTITFGPTPPQFIRSSMRTPSTDKALWVLFTVTIGLLCREKIIIQTAASKPSALPKSSKLS